MKKVKIVKSGSPNYWYSSKVGEIVEVEEYDETDYKVVGRGNAYMQYLLVKKDTVDVKEPNAKAINCKIDCSWLKGEAREVISEAIQKKLFEAGCKWYNPSSKSLDCSYLYVSGNMIYGDCDCKVFSGARYIWTSEGIAIHTLNEVSVNNALKGNFCTYSSAPKKGEPEGYKVSLTAYTGKAREAISKAIQEEAFKKGFGTHKTLPVGTEQPYLFFWMSDLDICWDSSPEYFRTHRYKELSVEEILSGALPKVN